MRHFNTSNMPKHLNNQSRLNRDQGGAVPLILLLATLGLLIFLFISNTFKFKDRLFEKLYPKPPSKAITSSPQIADQALQLHAEIKNRASTETKTYLFDGAKRAGVSMIRNYGYSASEIAPFPNNVVDKNYKWAGNDENYQMANARGLTILAEFTGSAPWMTPSGTSYNGPIAEDKLDEYATYIKDVVTHYPNITYWEVWNEPDLAGSFAGTYEDYAKMQKVAYQAIKEARPDALVLIGGPGGSKSTYSAGSWLDQVLNYDYGDGTKGKDYFDIANAHIRGSLSTVESYTKQARQYYNNIKGSATPLWVTEHGYPASPTYQNDPNYKGTDSVSGEQAQADYLKVSIPLLLSSGADKVFVELRDRAKDDGDGKCQNDGSRFCSEGLVTFEYQSSTTGSNRPSMAVIQSFSQPPSPSPSPSSIASPAPTPDITKPTVSITNPLNGATLSRNSTINIQATASDNIGVTKVEFYVDNSLKCTNTTSLYSCSWKVPGAKGRSYSIQAKAYDGAGNSSTATINVKSN